MPKELRTGDERLIVGVWQLKVSKIGETDYESAIGTKWTLGADGSAIRDRPNDGIGKATFKIDPKATPKSYDWNTEEGTTFLGVYELEGDTLRVTLTTGERPTVCKPSGNNYYFEFRRLK